MGVIDAWVADLRDILVSEPTAVSDVRMGVFYTAVALASGLGALRGVRRVVIAGPTASAWPRPLFERGAHVMGGIGGKDGRALLQVVSEGGSGCFFDNVAEKVAIVREGEALDIARRSAA